jgi:hypothetical protein
MATPTDGQIAWEREWDEAVQRARQERRLLLVDVEKEH